MLSRRKIDHNVSGNPKTANASTQLHAVRRKKIHLASLSINESLSSLDISKWTVEKQAKYQHYRGFVSSRRILFLNNKDDPF